MPTPGEWIVALTLIILGLWLAARAARVTLGPTAPSWIVSAVVILAIGLWLARIPLNMRRGIPEKIIYIVTISLTSLLVLIALVQSIARRLRQQPIQGCAWMVRSADFSSHVTTLQGGSQLHGGILFSALLLLALGTVARYAITWKQLEAYRPHLLYGSSRAIMLGGLLFIVWGLRVAHAKGLIVGARTDGAPAVICDNCARTGTRLSKWIPAREEDLSALGFGDDANSTN